MGDSGVGVEMMGSLDVKHAARVDGWNPKRVPRMQKRERLDGWCPEMEHCSARCQQDQGHGRVAMGAKPPHLQPMQRRDMLQLTFTSGYSRQRTPAQATSPSCAPSRRPTRQGTCRSSGTRRPRTSCTRRSCRPCTRRTRPPCTPCTCRPPARNPWSSTCLQGQRHGVLSTCPGASARRGDILWSGAVKTTGRCFLQGWL